ncbi:tail fiber protein [Edwardsiella tarda]|uniref:tail fiber protein n=1 Tax=Edwardsiella tarda TaxID=636 RepID=UPI00098F9DC2|nr:tail fiber protein [Edwardsiella tarda]
MSVKFYTLLTDVGSAKLAAAAASGIPLNITQMAVGDGGGSLPMPTPQQTALIAEKRRAALNMLYIDPQNSSQIIAEQVIPEAEGGWWIRELGLFDESGALIAIGNCPESYKPQLVEGSGRTQTVRMVLLISGTDNVTLNIDPSIVLATRQYVDQSLEDHLHSRNHPDATLTDKGFVQLSNATNSSSESLAATPKAVKQAYDEATRTASTGQAGRVQLNDSTNSTSTTQAATANAVKRTYDEATRTASTNQAGRVQLNDSTNSISTTQAATANAVKRIYDEVTRDASTNQTGRIQLNDSTNSTSITQAATANAVKRTYDEATRPASTSQAGRVQLNDSTNSTSTTQAATANAVKRTYDEATRTASYSQYGRVRVSNNTSDPDTTRVPTSDALRRVYLEATRLATVNQVGRVQLENSLYSSSTTRAATAKVVKIAYEAAHTEASLEHSGRVQLNDDLDSYKTNQAATPNAIRRVNERVEQLVSQVLNSLPVGVPIPWPLIFPPRGWVICAGQTFSLSVYPQLAMVYPLGILPDLRGEFIRGYDNDRGVDRFRVVLTHQADAIRNIEGRFGADDQTAAQLSGAFFRYSNFNYDAKSEGGNGYVAGFDASRVVPTANENRPRNVAFLYIVRAA